MSGILRVGWEQSFQPAGLSWGQWSSPQAWFGPQPQRGEAPCYSTAPAHLCSLCPQLVSLMLKLMLPELRWALQRLLFLLPLLQPAASSAASFLWPLHGSSLLLSLFSRLRTQSPIHSSRTRMLQRKNQSLITRNAFSFRCLAWDLGKWIVEARIWCLLAWTPLREEKRILQF